MNSELTAEQIERNTILARWFKEKHTNYIFFHMTTKFPRFREMDLVDDLKQEIFFRLAQKPIQWLREMDEANSFKSYIYKTITSFGEINSSIASSFSLANKSQEYESWKHDELLIFEPFSKQSIEQDLYDECVKCIDTLPMIERKSILLYKDLFIESKVWHSLCDQGFTVSKRQAKASIKLARAKVLESLFKKGFIERIPEFKKIHLNDNRGNRTITTKIIIAKRMISLEKLLSESYSPELSLAEKAIYALFTKGIALGAAAIIDFLDSEFEPGIINEKRQGIPLKKSISSSLSDPFKSGIVGKRIYRDNFFFEYFIQDGILSYLKKLLSDGDALNGEPARKWWIYKFHEENKMSFEEIGERMNVKPEYAKTQYEIADIFLSKIHDNKKSEEYN